MKRFILVLAFLLLAVCALSQVTTVVTDDQGVQTNVFYDHEGVITVSLQEKITQIEIDFDGEGKDQNDIILKYNINQGPTLMWNDDVKNYNIVFTLYHKGSNPVGGLIDLHSRSIMLFYSDGSTLLYIGEMELIQTIIAVIIFLLFIGLFFYLLFVFVIMDIQSYYNWRKFFKTHPKYKDNWKEHFKEFRANREY